MAQIQDGNFSLATQNGAAAVAFPLQDMGEYYARTITRELVALASLYSASYAPALQVLTSYANRLTYSEDFTNAAWTKNRVTVTPAQFANPADGLLTMSAVMETATTNTHYLPQNYTFTAAVPHTLSVFCKPNGRDWIFVSMYDGTTAHSAFFNVTTGAVGTLGGAATGKITRMGNGIYRCEVTATVLAAVGLVEIDLSTDGSTLSYAGDITKGIYIWGAQIEIAAYAGPYVSTTSIARTILAPNVDSLDALALAPVGTTPNPGDPFAYLCEETGPNSGDLVKGMARWTRLYARIPKDLTVYSTQIVTKPVPGSLGILLSAFSDYTAGLNSFGVLGQAYIYLNYLWGNNQIYYAKPVASSLTPASSGTFTITFGANTTAANNWNDSGATIATKINGLASVISAGITVTVSNLLNGTPAQLLITLSVGTTSSRFTMNAVGLNAGSKFAFTDFISSVQQDCRIGYMGVITAHGFSSSGNLAASDGDKAVLLAYSTNWVVVDSNTIAMDLTSVGAIVATTAGPFYRNYTPGVDRLRTKRVTSFYLPGVTAGIASPTDIPVPDPALNDAVFLALVISYTSGYQTYDADPLSLWLGSIYEQTLIQIDMATV